jgi:hypothetical protein
MALASTPQPRTDPCTTASDDRPQAFARADLDPPGEARLASALQEHADRFLAADTRACESGTPRQTVARCLEGRLAAHDRLVLALHELPVDIVRAQGLAAAHALPAPEACTRTQLAASWPDDVELRARLGPVVLAAERVTPLLEIGVVDEARAELDAALAELEAAPASSYLLRARLARLAIDEMTGKPLAADAYDDLLDLATEHEDLVAAARLWTRRLGTAANRGDVAELPTLRDTARWAFDLAGRPSELAPLHHEAQGFALFQLQRFADAEVELQAAIDAMLATEGSAHPKLAELRGALAMLMYRQGRVEEALAVTLEAWSDLEPVTDPGFPPLAHMAANLATYCDEVGQPHEAVRWARRGLDAMDQGTNGDPVLRTILVEAVVTRDELPRARREADALVTWAADLDPYVRGRAERVAARVAFRGRDFDVMRRHLDASEHAFERAGATGELVGTRYDRARLLRGEGDLAGAAEAFADVIAHEAELTGVDVTTRVQVRVEAAELALERGRATEARDLIAAAHTVLPADAAAALADRVTAMHARIARARN